MSSPTRPGIGLNFAHTVRPCMSSASRTIPAGETTRIMIAPRPNRALALPEPM